jgi:hypothetical protein
VEIHRYEICIFMSRRKIAMDRAMAKSLTELQGLE